MPTQVNLSILTDFTLILEKKSGKLYYNFAFFHLDSITLCLITVLLPLKDKEKSHI
jgi:hypothetical protein